jgi:hypothetical protein
MDVIAHGLWGGALFLRQTRKRFFAALLIGMAPDLVSFGVFHVMNPHWLTLRLAGEISGPPALNVLPPYVFLTYSVGHSLLVWALVFSFSWWVLKRRPWLSIPWLLHILCDIPTHTTRYFPTPFLWPFPTPFINGISWATPWFMVVNYAAIITLYSAMVLYLRTHPLAKT